MEAFHPSLLPYLLREKEKQFKHPTHPNATTPLLKPLVRLEMKEESQVSFVPAVFIDPTSVFTTELTKGGLGLLLPHLPKFSPLSVCNLSSCNPYSHNVATLQH